MEAQQTSTVRPAVNDAAQEKAQRFIIKAEKQVSKIILEMESMHKLANRKYHEYTPSQVEQMINALQSSLDELKASFTTGTAEHKKIFQFSK